MVVVVIRWQRSGLERRAVVAAAMRKRWVGGLVRVWLGVDKPYSKVEEDH